MCDEQGAGNWRESYFWPKRDSARDAKPKLLVDKVDRYTLSTIQKLKMKKRVGLAALDTKGNDRFQQFGTSLMNSQTEQLSSQLETFQQALAAFASTHAKDIKANPQYRATFSKMCTAIGIDPLASTANPQKSIWSEMLGLGELYHELAVQVVEICRRTRGDNGGLISVSEIASLMNAKNQRFGGSQVGEDDIVRAVKPLKVLESGFEVIVIGARLMVRSVPRELNLDQSVVLEAAQVLLSLRCRPFLTR